MWDDCDVLVQNKTIHSLNLFRTWSNISLKMATWAIGKTFHVITRARSLHYRFYRFGLVWPPLCFVDDLCQILGMFSLNSIGCVTKCGPAGILEEIQLTDVCKANVLKSSYRKIWSNILTARWRASAWSDKMNKEHLLMILRGSDSCKKYA